MTYRLQAAESLTPAGSARLNQIYQEGFPVGRHSSWLTVYAERTSSETALALVEEPATLVGLIFLRDFAGTDRIYLRFLAIGADQRGRGIGAAAWPLITAYCVVAGKRLLIWDVEHPDQSGIEAGEISIRQRRIGFYQRLGGAILPIDDYSTPHEDATGVHEIPMYLLAAHLDGAPLPTDAEWVAGVRRDVDRHRWNR